MSIKYARKLLGEKYDECTDEQIEQIRNFLYEMAKINVQIIRDVEAKVARGEMTWEEVLGEKW